MRTLTTSLSLKKVQYDFVAGNCYSIAEAYVTMINGGQAELCWISYEPENEVAKKLYASFGFVENGEMDDDEIVAVLKL